MDSLLLSINVLFPLLALGALAGVLAGLLGIGGGAVLVPGLLVCFHYLGFEEQSIMHMAVGTSLAIIVPTGLSSALSHARKGAFDRTVFLKIGPAVFFGALFGVAMAYDLKGAQLSLIFAIVILCLALIMVANPARFFSYKALPEQPFSALAGICIGSISSLVGIGGATLSVPFLTMHGLSIHKAIGTAAALGLCVSIPASLGFFYIGAHVTGLPPMSLGYIYFPAWLGIVVTSVLFAPLGVRLSHAIPVPQMRTGFAVFMVLVAIKMMSVVL